MHERAMNCHFPCFSSSALLLHRVQSFSKIFKALLNLSSDNLSSLPCPRFAPTVPTLANPGYSHPYSRLCTLGLKTEQNEADLTHFKTQHKGNFPRGVFLGLPWSLVPKRLGFDILSGQTQELEL